MWLSFWKFKALCSCAFIFRLCPPQDSFSSASQTMSSAQLSDGFSCKAAAFNSRQSSEEVGTELRQRCLCFHTARNVNASKKQPLCFSLSPISVFFFSNTCTDAQTDSAISSKSKSTSYLRCETFSSKWYSRNNPYSNHVTFSSQTCRFSNAKLAWHQHCQWYWHHPGDIELEHWFFTLVLENPLPCTFQGFLCSYIPTFASQQRL